MISNESKNFITKRMSIEFSSIDKKLSESAIRSYRPLIEGAVEEFSQLCIKGKSSLLDINERAEKWSADVEGLEAKVVIDALSHAFEQFADGSLHSLYTGQQNESWYPKIVLREILTPNDISTLNNPVVLFRGCDIQEYETQIYGQAWTTSVSIANAFAFTHYLGQPWFDLSKRTILKTSFNTEHALFSKQVAEGEVVVDTQ